MEQKLKIGFDAKRLFLNNTGLGNYSRNLVKNLSQLFPNHEYHLFTPKIVINKSTQHFLEQGFVIHTCPDWQPSWYWRSVGMASTINELKLDVFHGLSHEIPYGIDKSTKTIVTIHDLIYEKHPELFGWLNSKIYQFKYRSSCKRADKIFAMSKSTANDITALYHIKKDKIIITYQSCDESFHTLPFQNSRHDYFLYVGTINERKSLKDIVMAMSLMPDDKRKKLLVVGEGGSYKQEVIDVIKKKQLERWVDFKGALNNTELISLYENAICLILPSQYEGFGIPIIESLFRKTPVITCNNSSLPEAGGPGAIYINHGDRHALLQAMLEMQNENSREAYSKKGYQYVLENFDISKLTQLVFKEYTN